MPLILLKVRPTGVALWAEQVGSFRVLVISPCGYFKASIPDLIGVDSTPQFKDAFRELLAMKDFQSKESKFHF